MKQKTERELIEQIQDGLKAMKSGLRELQTINTDADRLAAANAAMGLRGELIVWHAMATNEMATHFPEFSAEIQTRSPGR